MAVQIRTRWISTEEYLAIEREAETKSEYFNGRIFAMAGASEPHNLIELNTGRSIGNQIETTPCRAYVSDMKVRIEATDLITYPDVVVICDSPRFYDDRRDVIENPVVLVEVLSPSTEAYDRGDKFAHYRHLVSFKEYLLISQDQIRIDHYVRQPSGQWLLTAYSRPEEVIKLESIGCELRLSDIYLKVDFPQPKNQAGDSPDPGASPEDQANRPS